MSAIAACMWTRARRYSIRTMGERTGSATWVAHLGVAAAVLDAHGAVRECSGELAALVGGARDAIVGRPLDPWLPASAAPPLRAAIADARERGGPVTYEDVVGGARARVTVLPDPVAPEGPDRGSLLVIHPATRAPDEAVRAQQLRQARLWERVLAAQEDERKHLARELHDHAGSSLAAMLLTCHALRDASSLAEARSAASRLAAELTSTLDDLARLARGLHPVALEQLGLGPALTRGIASIVRARQLDADVEVDLGDARMAASIEAALYRIAQEAVTNVIRHAEARRVVLRCRHDGGDVVLEIQDDGRGFDARDVDAFVGRGRLGLAGIRDRAALLGGSAVIASSAGGGTTLTVRIPRAPMVG